MDEYIDRLAVLGYQVRFVENIQSAAEKSPFLSRPRETHVLALAAHADGLPIELVCYDELAIGGGGLTPVFASNLPAFAVDALPDQCEARSVSEAMDGVGLRYALIPGLDTMAWFYSNGLAAGGLSAAVVRTRDIALSRHIWSDVLGFVPAAEGTGWVRLERKSPVPAWRFTLIVCFDPTASVASYLDSPGMSCLSLLSTNLEGDRREILRRGGALKSTGPFSIGVNGRRMRVEVYLTPDNVYVELLQVAGVCRSE